MIKCLIVDDEQHSIDVLMHYIGQTDFLHLVGTTTNAKKAVGMVNDHQVDLIFQDIHMPDLSGIDIVKAINGKCAAIFTTAYPNYAVEGFELGVVDYLLKPISYPRFITAVQKVVEKVRHTSQISPANNSEKADFIYVKTGTKSNVVKIVLSEVEYFESLKNYIAIYHASQKTLVYLSMKELEASLPADYFIRVHRSYIVALSKIIKVEGGDIILKGVNTIIPLSDTYRAAFWAIVNDKTIG